jgi:hypothetical protein
MMDSLVKGEKNLMEPASIADSKWGNWRQKGVNPAGIDVSKSIFLFPETKNFTFHYTNEYGDGWDASDPGGIFAKVSQAAETIRSGAEVLGMGGDVPVAGKMISKYKRSATWKGTDPIGIGELKFIFQFGQAGLFSGEHEVVRPILALASLWVPIETGTEHYYRGTLPTPPFVMMSVFKALAKDGIVDGGLLRGVVGGGNGLIGGLTKLEENLISIQEKGIQEAYANSKTRALYVRMGRLIMGPFIVKDVNWDFDFSQVDEYGFPYKGTITFGGLESVVMPDPIQVHAGFTYDNVTWNSDLSDGGDGYKPTSYNDPPASGGSGNSGNSSSGDNLRGNSSALAVGIRNNTPSPR